MSIVFGLLPLALLPIFVLLLKRLPIWVSLVFFFLVIVEGVFVAFYTLINFSGAFGPGIVLFCVSAICIPIGFLACIVLGVRQFPQFGHLQKIVFVIGGAIILFAQSSPVIGDYGIGGYCDKKRMEYGNEVVVKIEQYYNDIGEYPSKVEHLIPAYLSNKPVYNCMESFGLHIDSLMAYYAIAKCEGKPALVTKSTDGARDIWYEFEAGKWSSISFLDSDCY